MIDDGEEIDENECAVYVSREFVFVFLWRKKWIEKRGRWLDYFTGGIEDAVGVHKVVCQMYSHGAFKGEAHQTTTNCINVHKSGTCATIVVGVQCLLCMGRFV